MYSSPAVSENSKGFVVLPLIHANATIPAATTEPGRQRATFKLGSCLSITRNDKSRIIIDNLQAHVASNCGSRPGPVAGLCCDLQLHTHSIHQSSLWHGKRRVNDCPSGSCSLLALLVTLVSRVFQSVSSVAISRFAPPHTTNCLFPLIVYAKTRPGARRNSKKRILTDLATRVGSERFDNHAPLTF